MRAANLDNLKNACTTYLY